MPFTKVDGAIFCIFGAGGDLSKRKLLPALYNLFLNKSLPERLAIIGLAREGDVAGFRDNMKAAIEEFSRRPIPHEESWDAFASNITFTCGDFSDPGVYRELQGFVARKEKEWGIEAVRVYYLSVPPGVVEMISE